MEHNWQADWMAKWGHYAPARIAIRQYETQQELTYWQLNRRAAYLMQYLQSNYHLKAGDRIAILAENSLVHVLLFAVAQKLGVVLVPLNYRLSSNEIAYLLQDAEPSLIVAANSMHAKLPPISKLSTIAIQTLWVLSTTIPEDFDEWAIETAVITPGDPIFILYTSGTTGFPKGALYTHQMLFWNSINTSLSLLLNTESRTLNCMPLFHTGGWNVLLTPFLHHGAFTCLLEKFDATAILQLLEQERISIFMGVPTMLRMLAEEAYFDNADLTHLHYVIVGGEPMPLDLIERWHNKGVPVRQGYGMTEVGPNLTSLHQDDAIRKKGSIGRPNFYVQKRVVDAAGIQVPSHTAGELQLRGPMVTTGYWRNEEASEKAFQNGWFRTGDMVYEDEEGYLYVVDRIKNMFISGGENVYPAEVERVLLQHELVDEVVVIGVADERWGEVGLALIVAARQTDELQAILEEYAKAQLATFKVPKHWRFLEALPKNDTGKYHRKSLKEQYRLS